VRGDIAPAVDVASAQESRPKELDTLRGMLGKRACNARTTGSDGHAFKSGFELVTEFDGATGRRSPVRTPAVQGHLPVDVRSGLEALYAERPRSSRSKEQR